MIPTLSFIWCQLTSISWQSLANYTFSSQKFREKNTSRFLFAFYFIFFHLDEIVSILSTECNEYSYGATSFYNTEFVLLLPSSDFITVENWDYFCRFCLCLCFDDQEKILKLTKWMNYFSSYLSYKNEFYVLMRKTFWCDYKLYLHLFDLLTDFCNDEQAGFRGGFCEAFLAN